MSTKSLKVIVTRRLPESVEARLTALFNTTLNTDDTLFTRADLEAAMQTADVLVSTLNDSIDAKLLAKAGKQLKLIANYGSGFDHIDVKAAQKRKIAVSNTPSGPAADTADMAMALILAVTRRFKEGSAVMSSGDWSGWSPSDFLGTRVQGKKLGILGMGRVGTELARRARAFGMDIHYHNRNKVHPATEKELNATYWDSLKLMLTDIDVLSVSCPYNSKTAKILNKQSLALMKPDAFLINTARGELIDEDVLADMLKNGKLAGAGLDVLERGHEINPALRDLNNLMLLPHMGSATKEARQEMGEKLVYNIKMMEDGHRPPNLILPNMV
ncbi:D-glycerate dehydrogenase [Amylibacter kogurei]|uniref:D-glycerate dehydrogenase n=1 Tax=Paramylibacter kogurei TaxID=1889778 RepID=A0A2G5K650_9RHOB|nr:D-glycerate dehydrogenase [Amylibacter kogurei]PIB25026.1 D-glycerate dehydrogenase [Amylibacter kogurei]